MILLIDIGNSRSKYAMLYPDRLRPGGVVDNSEGPASLFSNVPDSPTGIYLSSVGAKAVLAQFVEWCQEQWGCTPVLLAAKEHNCGVINGYLEPAKLGVDRWLAIIGAYRLVQGAVLVIDCGTVCTADLVDSRGRHRGGAMMPGARLMNQALQSGTEGVRAKVEIATKRSWGDSTAGCIAYGIHTALVGFIEQMTVQAEEALDEPVATVLTGGDAPLLMKALNLRLRYEKDLVFYGMAAMVDEKEQTS